MALREVLAHFGFQVDSKPLEKGQKSADGFASKLGGITKVLAAGALVQGMRSFVSDLTAQADQLIDTSASLGVGTQDLQRWQLAAKLSGAEATDLATGLKNISRVANEPSQAGLFKSLGVDIKDASGEAKNATQLMRDVGLSLAQIKSPTERTAKALEVFGKSGTKLVPMFAEGEAGLEALLAKLDELGGGLGDDALAVLGEAGDLTDEFNVATTSLKSRLAVSLFPTFNRMIGWVTKGIAAFSRASEGTNIFKAAIVVLGVAGAIAGASMLAPWIPLLAALAVAILLVDDLITLFDGGDSAIGRFIDSIFGVGAASDMVRVLKDTWKDLVSTFKESKSLGEFLGKAFDKVWPLLEEALSVVGAKIVGWLVTQAEGLAEPAKALGLRLLNAILEGLFGLPVMLSLKGAEAVQSLIQAVVRGALDLVAKGQQLANSMVEGFVNGIGSGVGAAVGAVGKWADGIEEALRKKFGWRSPTDMTFDLGFDMDRGAVEGLEAGAPLVARQAEKSLGVSVPGGGRGRGGAGGGNLNMDAKVQVTIQAAPGTAGIQDAARRGVGQGLREGGESILQALEPVGPSLPVPG